MRTKEGSPVFQLNRMREVKTSAGKNRTISARFRGKKEDGAVGSGDSAFEKWIISKGVI